MKRMKRAVSIIMSVVLGSSLMAGCGGSSNSASAAKEQTTNQEQQISEQEVRHRRTCLKSHGKYPIPSRRIIL
ncbi:MAG: hypothetical protein ACLVD8_27285 [Enterocloster sp.]|uniref:hypothetical protein n=1 Tax=Enterocloster sp. TaxID=2719315 RepID=UPI003999692F